MNKFVNFFKKLWSFLNSRIFSYIIIAIVSIVLIRTCSVNNDMKIEKKIDEQNISALNDSVKTYITKYNKLQSTIPVYIANERELKKLNRSLYNEVKKQEGNVISLNRTVIRLKNDSTELSNRITSILETPIKVNGSTYTMRWFFTDKKYNDKFDGITTVGLTISDRSLLFNNREIDSKLIFNSIKLEHLDSRLTNQEFNVDLTFGEKVVDDKLYIFAETNRKDIKFTNMEGYFIDPNNNKYINSLMKKSKWFPGTFSIGVGAGAGYDIFHARPALIIGITGQYTIYQW